MNISNISRNNIYAQNQKPATNPQRPTNTKQIQFTGKADAPVSFVQKYLLKGLGWLADRKATEKTAKFIAKHEAIEKNLFPHLIVLGSTIMSGFYIGKTLNNKNLDKEKRQTLAINQTLTYIVSTVAAYTLDSKMKNWYKKNVVRPFNAFKGREFNKEIANFIKDNPTMKKAEKATKIATKRALHTQKLEKWQKGMNQIRQLVIFGTAYRFFAPVLVTPIANAIGNSLQKSDKA